MTDRPLNDLLADLLADLRAALMLLTRLPVWRLADDGPPDLSRSVWAYPPVGALVGGLGAAVWAAGAGLGVPALVAAVLAFAATILATGAFHEDGLADTADGLGGGLTVDRKLEIMRDSRIGTYGTVAVVLSLGLRIAALSALPLPLGAAALVTLACASRGAIVLMLAGLAPARTGGMGAVAGNPPRAVVVAGLILAALPLVFWPFGMGAGMGVAVIAATACVAWTARRQVGGYTGDLLGAGQQLSECAGWVVLAALLPS
ncbi:adenosylcobinamide-GDP ribazoletransferase [Eilatimonas milleporae]|uniref:Adenosylcobinamide-GDP ribazoletransferase n=1 Tax=Eilatimonas milleporae TaxID=911205 RepID=A0A3M0CPM0_9PROT|nr:adenosylcobinamide-GDP ribazoletransferase [Eilatimonas milleporae]RMB08726.1 cobalamin-5'-phosphate synthase [Eilatimonas milleporae]